MTHDTSLVPYRPYDVSGVLAGRCMAVIVDLVIVGFIAAVLWLVIGLTTLGLGLFVLPPLFPLVGLVYSGLTVSGPNRGTIGMRMFGVEIRTMDGGTPDFVIAAVHAVFFYVSVSMLTPLVLIVGLFRDDRRLLHDLLTNIIAVRRGSP
jgi:uncharacterized RDD family membrane protein YckC